MLKWSVHLLTVICFHHCVCLLQAEEEEGADEALIWRLKAMYCNADKAVSGGVQQRPCFDKVSHMPLCLGYVTHQTSLAVVVQVLQFYEIFAVCECLV